MASIKLTEEMLAELQFINTEDLRKGVYEFPDFMIVGPQATGTTWLQKNLIFHPQIFMSARKELHFFSKLYFKDPRDTYFRSDRLEWYSQHFESNIWNYLKRNAANLKFFRNLSVVDLNFFQFFSDILVKGEASASYAAMHDSLISEVVLLNPNLKVIVLIRHPVDRAWSSAKKELIKKPQRTLDEVPFARFQEYYTHEYQLKCGNFTTIINSWEQRLKPGNIFVDFFDRIGSQPKALLLSIFSFLGVDINEEFIREEITGQVINPTPYREVPEEHRTFLQALFSDEISRLNQRFGVAW